MPEAGLWDEICYRADDTEEWDKRLNAAAQHDSEHVHNLQQRLDSIRREKMDWADRADIATRLRAEEVPNDVADHAGYIADEVNLLAAQRTYELRRLGVDEPAQEAIRDMVAETIAAAYEPDNDDTHHDEQDAAVQNTVEEEQPAPETTAEDEDADELHEGAQAGLDFLASLGLGGEQQSVTSDSDTTDEQAPADELEEEQGPEL